MTVLAFPAAPIVAADIVLSPALVYLARLSPSGRRSQHHALNTMASILSHGLYDALSLPWAALRYERRSERR